MQTYSDMPILDEGLSSLPVKIFMIEKRWANSALINAVFDDGVLRDGYLWLGDDLTTGKTAQAPLAGSEIISAVKAGKEHPLINVMNGITLNNEQDSLEVGLIDIVTYPVWQSLIHDVDTESELAAGVITKHMKLNYNLIAPYVSKTSELFAILTIPHFKEKPVDDAPTHNIVCYQRSVLTAYIGKTIGHKLSAAEIEAHILRLMNSDILALLASAPNIIPVFGDEPVMDDRYLMIERRPQDGDKRRLINYESIVLE